MIVLGDPERVAADAKLAAALVRLLATDTCPQYVRTAATPWVAARLTK